MLGALDAALVCAFGFCAGCVFMLWRVRAANNRTTRSLVLVDKLIAELDDVSAHMNAQTDRIAEMAAKKRSAWAHDVRARKPDNMK